MVSTEIKNDRKNSLYHSPATVFFHHHSVVKETRIKIPVDEFIANSTNNIQKYGYAVIVLHRQDFEISDIITDYLQDSLKNVVNENEINDLLRLVDKILSKYSTSCISKNS
jgi:hypothetical protein